MFTIICIIPCLKYLCKNGISWGSPSLDLNPHPYFSPVDSGGWHVERVIIDRSALLAPFSVALEQFAPMVTGRQSLKIFRNALLPKPVP